MAFPPVVTESGEARRTLYPALEPFESARLKVDDLHELHYEQCGNPQGKPVIVLHGGPGGGIAAFYRSYFDPLVYRIVLLDQRGAGQSTPFAELKDNTTWHLVADIERLRTHLGIDRWVVFGGSWGSTLALAYAQTHPTAVKALVLRGIFLLRRAELLWFYQEGASWIHSDAWEEYLAPIPEVERGDLMSAYHRRLTGSDEAEKVKCARAWAKWEMATSRLKVDPAALARADDDKFSVAFARIECHYFVNGGFFESKHTLLDKVDVLREHQIPAVIVQGRYDMVCPFQSAWDLHKAWPEAQLVVVPDAGHSMKEDGILSELVQACDHFSDL
jgi:proline iminopeptidase